MSKKIYLTEAQINYIIEQKRLDESIFSINNLKKTLIISFLLGAITVDEAEKYMQSKEFSGEQIEQMVQDMQQANQEWELIANDGIITVYNAVAAQCNSDYTRTASGFRLNINDVASHKICAMERTMMAEFGLKYGDIIKIEGTYKGLQDGVYQIQDTMNKRFAGQHKIDILVPNNIRTGGTLKNQPAKVYKLSDKERAYIYTQNMAPSLKKGK